MLFANLTVQHPRLVRFSVPYLPSLSSVVKDLASRHARLAPARGAIVVLIAAWLASCATARDRTSVIRLDSGLTVVPFAVPVATPVAVVQPGGVYYAVVPQGAGDDVKLRAEFEEFKRWRKSQLVANSTPSEVTTTPSGQVSPSPLFVANCLACHRGRQAKGGVRLDVALSSEQRLAAIRAVLSGEMPKGKPLAPDVLGELLLEISQTSSPPPVQGE